MREYNDDIIKACQVLRDGGVILYPTDTIWGLGCDASNSLAVKRIYEIKKRIESKLMIVLVDSQAKLSYYTGNIPNIAYDLIDLSVKPLTIVYSGARNLAPELVAADGSAGIRVTQEPFSKELCARFRGAVVSTSANISGDDPPLNFGQISVDIIKSVDYVVSFRQKDISCPLPSSIIKLDAWGQIKIIRE